MTLHVGATNATVQQPQLIVGYIVDAPHYLHPLLITRRAMLLPRAQVRQYGVGAHYDWKYAHLQHSAIRRSKQDVRSLQNCEWHVSCTAPRTQRTVSARNSRSEGHEAATDSGSSVQQAFDFDVFVIGGGSGGVRAAKIAANGGATVALAELPLDFMAGPDRGGVGGTCVLRGCVPKKLMLYVSEFATEARASKGFGWVEQSEAQLDWTVFLEAKRQELQRLNKAYKESLDRAGVKILEGRAQLLGPHEVQVAGHNRTYRAKNIVIATGGQAKRIPIPGAEHAIISDQVLELERLPSVVTLIGGGYIGMEFAGMFARLGCEVHVVARQALPLAPRFDEEVCQFFLEQCEKSSGIRMHMRSNPLEIIREDSGKLTVRLEPVNNKPSDHDDPGTKADSQTTPENSTGTTDLKGNDVVVLAVGRGASTKGLGLEKAGVEIGPKGILIVNEYSQTNVPHIWAVGDVTSRVALTPVAIMEGQAVGQSIATGQLQAPQYDAVPSACFGWPFVGTVGLTEKQVADQGLKAEVYTTTFTPLKARLAARVEGAEPQKDLVKMLVEVGSGKVLGLHLVGEDAPEIVQGFALAVKHGLTKKQVDCLVGVHPTAAEEVIGLPGPARRVGCDKE